MIVLAFLLLFSQSEGNSLVDKLNSKIVELQIAKDQPTYRPPFGWKKVKGLYPSWIHIYMHGNSLATSFRRSVKVWDNNAFATSWISIQMAEAALYGGCKGIREAPILSAVKAVVGFADRNRPNGSTVTTFWKQTFNKTSGLWTQTDDNMLGAIELGKKAIPWSTLTWVLDHIGMSDISENLKRVRALFDIFPHIFKLPADFDDSSVNIGLGMLLKDSTFQTSYAYWSEHNSAIQHYMSALKLYAYRPFGTNNQTSIIDGRTYFYLRQYLEIAKQQQRQIALVTTWAQNITENLEQRPSVATPLNVNNVDCTVAANSIYAITSALLAGYSNPDDWFDSDVQMIYLNTSDFIVWAINSGVIENRPDLALTYYPSQYNFYWFFARTLFLIRSKENDGIIPAPQIQEVKRLILTARASATDWLLKQGVEQRDWLGRVTVYFDDFLGNGDTLFGKPKKYGEARVASTSMAINAFLALWTTFNSTDGRLHMDLDIPPTVKDRLAKAINWLNYNLFTTGMQYESVFFSGSAKGNSTQPGSYPLNYFYYLNGTKPDPKHFDIYQVILGWQSVVSEATYQKWIALWNREVYPVPLSFPGYNAKGSLIWPYWSSPAFTYSTTLLALAQYANIA